MKKVLFATTALVATAGVAHADLELTGGAIFGLKDDGVAGGDVFLHGEIDINIVGSGSTDNGLTFGASMDVDADAGAGANTPGTSDFEAFISGDFGTISVGNLSQAGDRIGLDDVGFDGVGVDDDLEGLRVGGADVTYAITVGGFDIILSGGIGTTNGADAIEGDFGIGLGYTIDGFTIEAAYDNDESANATSTGIELGYAMNGFDVGVTWIRQDSAVDTTGYGVDFGYTMDALSIGLAWGDTDAAGDDADFGIGASYDLGGGLSIQGGVGNVDGNSVWDLGVVMSF